VKNQDMAADLFLAMFLGDVQIRDRLMSDMRNAKENNSTLHWHGASIVSSLQML